MWGPSAQAEHCHGGPEGGHGPGGHGHTHRECLQGKPLTELDNILCRGARKVNFFKIIKYIQ